MAGLAAARARGRLGGRPRKMTKYTLKMVIAVMSDKESNALNVAKSSGLRLVRSIVTSMVMALPKKRGNAC